MAFRVVRQRREARRTAKLDEIFQDRDKNQNGKISFEQLEDIFRIYQVDLDERASNKITDDNGDISKEDFVKIAQDSKLLDFGNVMAGDGMKGVSAKKQSRTYNPTAASGQGFQAGKSSLLCCCGAEDGDFNTELEPRVDRVEAAFRKFDLDGDGFLDWEEFKQIGMELEQSRRIFKSCDQEEKGQITLEDFRRVANRKPASGSLIHED